jgi:O-antigen biosynthesis protein
VSAIVSMLWPDNHSVLVELARNGWRSFAWMPEPVPEVVDRLATWGAHGRAVSVSKERTGNYGRELSRRIEGLSPLVDQYVSPLGAEQSRMGRVGNAALEALKENLRTAMLQIDGLQQIYEQEGVAALLLNHTETHRGRAAARWAHAKNIPVFMLTHGANLNRYYTCSAGMEADRVFVFGERGMDALLDEGEPRDKFFISGAPGWDGYAALRTQKAESRRKLDEITSFRPDEPVVLFATTWAARLSAFGEPRLFERTTQAFLEACALLRGRGRRFNALVKGRPMNANAADAIHDLAVRADFTDYALITGPIALPLAAADVVVGFDTSVFVEAMLLGIPCINLWTESSWVFGPPYAAYDGIPLAGADDPASLADRLEPLLADPEARRRAAAESAYGLSRLSLPPDGAAAARVAKEIARFLPPPSTPWSLLAANGRDPVAAANEEPPGELIDVLPRAPRLALIFDVGNGALVRALKARYPGIRTIGTESDPVMANAVRDTLDVVLERTPESIEWPLAEAVGEPIDTVILPGTLHRCINPWRFLERLRNAVAPNAQIVASVANARNFWTLAELSRPSAQHSHTGPLALERLRWFNQQQAFDVFRDAGFGDVRIDGVIDPRSNGVTIPPDGTAFTVELPELSFKGLTAAGFNEQRMLHYLVVASP